MNGRLRLALLGLIAGLAGALLPVVAAFALTVLLQPADDAVSAFWNNKVSWMPLSAMFGLQVGMYAIMRKGLHIPFFSRTGGAAMGTGGGTSTLAMVACCAPAGVNLLLPLLGFTGITGLLANWSMPFMVLSVGANAIGIGLMLYAFIRQWKLKPRDKMSRLEATYHN